MLAHLENTVQQTIYLILANNTYINILIIKADYYSLLIIGKKLSFLFKLMNWNSNIKCTCLLKKMNFFDQKRQEETHWNILSQKPWRVMDESLLLLMLQSDKGGNQNGGRRSPKVDDPIPL